VPAAAQEPFERGWYVGASLGSATARFDTELTHIDGAMTSSISTDDQSGYGKIYAGFQITPWFAVEGGVTNLGAYSQARTVTLFGTGTIRADVESAGLHFDAVFMARTQSAFTPFGKVGVVLAGTRVEYTTTGSVAPPGGNAVHEQSDGFLKLGVGLDYAFNRNLFGRVELERMSTERKTSRAPEEDINVYRSIGAFSLGLAYRF
jgi:OOP family OmpA-OmpF porin